ncbi:hypothetical protein [Haloarchaeobius amylolyticus]|uniref:hypothetical protein n=1 Tax=Haloarchaeobius amylolyticus TaxID=1198296 RepID=UPI0022717A19|nr:hypothetical protein [Haloarchaeobius amylolyticus]
MTPALPAPVDELFSRAEDAVDDLGSDEDGREGSDGGEDESDALPTEMVDPVDDLVEVADEAEDVLETVDVTGVLSAVDWDALPETAPDVVDLDELPDAVGDGDPGDAVRLRALARLLDLSDVWEAADVRAFWRQQRELDEAVSELVGADEADEASDEGDDGGLDVGGIDAGGGVLDADAESVENAVQSEVADAVGEFRASILEAHVRLREKFEENQETAESRHGSTDSSRNPTAVSTMPGSSGGALRHSTVPEETRCSTAPNRKRIYGGRFDEATGGTDE